MYDWKQGRAGKFNKMLGLFLDLQPRFGNKATLIGKKKERKKESILCYFNGWKHLPTPY